MSRPTRAGSAGKPVTIRATDAERERWELTALWSEMSLSEWIRAVINRKADEAERLAPAGAWDDSMRRMRRRRKR